MAQRDVYNVMSVILQTSTISGPICTNVEFVRYCAAAAAAGSKVARTTQFRLVSTIEAASDDKFGKLPSELKLMMASTAELQSFCFLLFVDLSPETALTMLTLASRHHCIGII